MISKPLTIQAHRSGNQVPLRNHSDLEAVISESGTEWVLIAPEEDSDREFRPDDQLLESFDVLSSETDPLLHWMWSRTSPHLVSCIGITAPTLVRASALQKLTSSQELPLDLSLLWDFARADAHFGTIAQVEPPDRNGTPAQLRSPIPERESHSPLWLRNDLLNLPESELVPDFASKFDATAVKAGVLLIHDYLESSHSVSQSIEGEGRNHNGDYWHAIMHRREPDFGNSKYWFRRVGSHPLFPQLASIAREMSVKSDSPEIRDWVDRLTSPDWNSFEFVDLCQKVHEPNQQGSELHQFVERLQMQEMLLLLRQSWEDATR